MVLWLCCNCGGNNGCCNCGRVEFLLDLQWYYGCVVNVVVFMVLLNFFWICNGIMVFLGCDVVTKANGEDM